MKKNTIKENNVYKYQESTCINPFVKPAHLSASIDHVSKAPIQLSKQTKNTHSNTRSPEHNKRTQVNNEQKKRT